jgi:hypothetical protein
LTTFVTIRTPQELIAALARIASLRIVSCVDKGSAAS